MVANCSREHLYPKINVTFFFFLKRFMGIFHNVYSLGTFAYITSMLKSFHNYFYNSDGLRPIFCSYTEICKKSSRRRQITHPNITFTETGIIGVIGSTSKCIYNRLFSFWPMLSVSPSLLHPRGFMRPPQVQASRLHYFKQPGTRFIFTNMKLNAATGET